jgi:2-oxoglutarate dehydrogenase E2 component (dihydrolipoamide succinyltransferase)
MVVCFIIFLVCLSLCCAQVTVEVRSPSAGKVLETFAGEGDEVTVGEPLFVLESGGEAPAAEAAAAPAPAKEKADAKADTKAAAAPAKVETKAAATPAAKPAAAKPAAPSTPSTPSKVTIVSDRSETRVKMTRMRQRIAQRLKEAQNTAAMLTTFQETDMGNLMELRNKYKEEFEKIHGVKLGFMSAFVKVCQILS